MIIWSMSMCCFTTGAFHVKELNVDTYTKYFIQGIAETVGYGIAPALFLRLNARLIFSVSFLIMIVGGGGLVFCDLKSLDNGVVYTFEVLAIVGSAMAYSGSYAATPLMFPTKVAGTCVGYCNMIGISF